MRPASVLLSKQHAFVFLKRAHGGRGGGCFAYPPADVPRSNVDKLRYMETRPALAQNSVLILSCDGDATLRQGDWLRLWNSTGMGIAHDVWVGVGGIVYENSGPGGFVRRNTLANVLAGRKVDPHQARDGPG